MPEKKSGSIYSVDTSSFMDWQDRFYPVDVFLSVAARIDALVAENRFMAPALVKEEVGAVASETLNQWVKARPGIFIPTAEILAEALDIQNKFPGLRDPKAEFEEADAYVIALAKLRSGFVVTQETPAAEKQRPKRTHFIPDVCRELGVSCINLLGLMRREKWEI